MATTLKATPTLRGKESERFNAAISTSKIKKISEEKRTEIFTLVNKIITKKSQ